jgi:hypothetical protein
MLDQVVKGFEREPLQNGDLARIGGAVLRERALGGTSVDA